MYGLLDENDINDEKIIIDSESGKEAAFSKAQTAECYDEFYTTLRGYFHADHIQEMWDELVNNQK